MEAADINAMFEDILRDFPSIRRDAKQAAGSDDVFVKIAAMGFARVAPDRPWGPEQAAIVRSLREGDYSDEMLEWYDAGRETVALFACLCYGAMLGLDAAGRMTEKDRALGEALLPGFIMSKLSDAD